MIHVRAIALGLALIALTAAPMPGAEAARTDVPSSGACRVMTRLAPASDVWFGRVVGQRITGDFERLQPHHRILCFAARAECEIWLRRQNYRLANTTFAQCRQGSRPR